MMNENDIDRGRELKRQLAAFSDYLIEGMEFVSRNYPGQVDFVKNNKEKSFEEISEYIEREFIAISQQ